MSHLRAVRHANGFDERHHELLNMPAVGPMVFLGVRWEGG
jgi:hypothetical protein